MFQNLHPEAFEYLYHLDPSVYNIFPRYRRSFCEGGYGSVFDLRDNNFERNVAVKMLSGDHAENIKLLRNFTHEALISAQLDHPNILPVYDMDVSEDGSLFYTMKKVEGYSLIEALDNDIPDGVDNQIKSKDDIVRVFIKVAGIITKYVD